MLNILNVIAAYWVYDSKSQGMKEGLGVRNKFGTMKDKTKRFI